MKYVALLRGINVGGNRKVPMSDLKVCLENIGLENVRTYIQSGNVLFESESRDPRVLEKNIETAIEETFGFPVPTVVLSADELKSILDQTPKGWNEDPEWKYNYIFLKSPYDEKEVIDGIGVLKPDIEALTLGKGIIYQSMLFSMYGRTTTGKLASRPVYQLMTIRNHNTVSKLVGLLSEE